MNKTQGEVVLIGGAFLLAPVIACAVAIPFFGCKNPLWPIAIGTIAAMAVYIGACLLHSWLYQEESDDEEKQLSTSDNDRAVEATETVYTANTSDMRRNDKQSKINGTTDE